MKLKRYILTVLGVMLMTLVAGAAEPLKEGADSRLDKLFFKANPTITLNDGIAEPSSDAQPLVVRVEVGSEKLLSSQQQAFDTAELIILNLNSAKDESVRITSAMLSQYTSLKYVVVIYGYDACNGGDDCLSNKTNSIIKLPNGSEAKVYHQLSIPK